MNPYSHTRPFVGLPRWRHLFLAVLLVASVPVADASAQVREWTTRSGQTIEAEVRSLSYDGKLILRKTDGDRVRTRLDSLSDEDIEFIRATGGDLGKMLAYNDELHPVDFLGYVLGSKRSDILDRLEGKLVFGEEPEPPTATAPSRSVKWAGDIDERTETWARYGNNRFDNAEFTGLTFRYGRLVRVLIRFRVPFEQAEESKLFEAILGKLQDKFGDFSATSTYDIDAREVWQGTSGNVIILALWNSDETTSDEVITVTALHNDLNILADRAELQEVKKSLGSF